jgi:hypothetical protein
MIINSVCVINEESCKMSEWKGVCIIAVMMFSSSQAPISDRGFMSKPPYLIEVLCQCPHLIEVLCQSPHI